MNRAVDAGKTILVDGPAAVSLLTGKTEVFAGRVPIGRKIVIREGKRLPFAVTETAIFNISLGANANFEEVNGHTIPDSWVTAFESVKSLEKKPAFAMIFGAVDSGKTSFCTYLANRLVNEKQSVALIDEDLGQSDIGPPCTVAYAKATGPFTDLFNLKAERTHFIGVTSPSRATARTVAATARVKEEILSKETVEFIIVNTDGWAGGEEAVAFKSELATALKPDVIFCLQRPEEIPSFCASLGDALGEFREERAESPAAVSLRGREKRRTLRELGYAKFLSASKIKTIPFSRLRIEDATEVALNEAVREKTKRALLASLGRHVGLLVALQDKQDNFLGIGVSQGVDITRKMLKIRTAVATDPVKILVGKVRLDENLHEVPAEPQASNH